MPIVEVNLKYKQTKGVHRLCNIASSFVGWGRLGGGGVWLHQIEDQCSRSFSRGVFGVFTRVLPIVYLLFLAHCKSSKVRSARCKCFGSRQLPICWHAGNLLMCARFSSQHCLVSSQLWFGLKTHQPTLLFIGRHDTLVHISLLSPYMKMTNRYFPALVAPGRKNTHVFIVSSSVKVRMKPSFAVAKQASLNLADNLARFGADSLKQWLGNMTTPTTGKSLTHSEQNQQNVMCFTKHQE